MQLGPSLLVLLSLPASRRASGGGMFNGNILSPHVKIQLLKLMYNKTNQSNDYYITSIFALGGAPPVRRRGGARRVPSKGFAHQDALDDVRRGRSGLKCRAVRRLCTSRASAPRARCSGRVARGGRLVGCGTGCWCGPPPVGSCFRGAAVAPGPSPLYPKGRRAQKGSRFRLRRAAAMKLR